jgi:hypothetical protein
MEFTTKWSLWGLRVNAILYYMVSFMYLLTYVTWVKSPPHLGLWTVGTGDLGRIPLLALGLIS